MVFSKLFGADKTPIAGLDISQDYITLIKLKKEDNKQKLQFIKRIPTPEGSYNSGIIYQAELLGDLVKKIIVENELGDLKINMAVPPNIPFIKLVSLPNLPPEELKTIARDEASSNVPFPINEANLDFAVLSDTRRTVEGGKVVVDVLIVAIQKSVAQKYLDLADMAKIKLNSIDVSSFAMLRGLAYNDQIKEGKDLVVSVLVGYDHTDITLVGNGMPLFSHSAAIGKKNIIETISSGLGMDVSTAKEFIPQVAILVPGYSSPTDPQVVKAATVVRMIYNNLSAEIQKAIQFYKTQKTNIPEISKIILGGSGMCITNADVFIANRLKVETELAKSFQNITLSADQPPIQDVPSLITGLGLALKGL